VRSTSNNNRIPTFGGAINSAANQLPEDEDAQNLVNLNNNGNRNSIGSTRNNMLNQINGD
jgi:hypothetical protein